MNTSPGNGNLQVNRSLDFGMQLVISVKRCTMNALHPKFIIIYSKLFGMKILTVKDERKHCQNSFIKSDKARNIQAKGEGILILCCCPVYMLGIV